MFICEPCLKEDDCQYLHLMSSYGPCEVCGKRTETWDCIHYKRAFKERAAR